MHDHDRHGVWARPGHVVPGRRRRFGKGVRLAGQAGQAGQALVETLVVCTALVPLLLLLIALGKLNDLRQGTVAASRALAFDCAVRNDRCRDPAVLAGLADDLRRRQMGGFGAALRSGEVPELVPVPEQRNPFWVDRRNASLLARYDDVGVRVEALSFDAAEGHVRGNGTRIAANALDLVSSLAGPGRFGLDWRGGFLDAQVQTAVASDRGHSDFSQVLELFPTRLRAHTALLADGWSASGPYRAGAVAGLAAASVEARVHQGSRLGAAEAAIDAGYLATRGFIAGMNAIGLEPAGDQLRYREVDVDLVPDDRRVR